MRLLKKIAFIFIVLLVVAIIGVMMVGKSLTPRPPEMEPRRRAAVVLHESAETATVPIVPAVLVPSDAASTSTLASTERPELPRNVWYGEITDDESGRPIYGATVMILQREITPTNIADKSFVLASTKSGADGKYRLELDTASIAPALLPSPVLQASATGYCAAANRYTYDPSGGRADFSLLPGGAISGRVKDDKGAPIVGAIVGEKAIFEGEYFYPEMYKTLPSIWAVTDEEGRFEIAGLRRGGKFRLPVRAKGFLPAITENIPVGESNAAIVLRHSIATALIIVKRPDGSVVPGVDVMAQPTVRSFSVYYPWSYVFPASCRGVTDAKGECTLTDFEPGPFQIEFDYHATSTEPSQKMTQWLQFGESVAGVTNRYEITLHKLLPVSGVFLDSQSCGPGPGVRVSSEFYDKQRPMPDGRTGLVVNRAAARPEVITGADGRFTISVPELDHYFYYRLPAGYTEDDGGFEGGGALIKMKPEYRIRRGVILPVRVSTSKGGAATGAQVVIHDRHDPVGPRWRGVTDGEGRCRILVTPGTDCVVQVTSDDGYASTQTEPIADHPTELAVTLDAFAIISGRVTLDGRPFPNVAVIASTGYDQRMVATTGADGKYTIGNVRPGSVTLSWSGWENFSDVAPKMEALTLGSGESRDGVDAHFESRGAFSTISRKIIFRFMTPFRWPLA
ncbi:hypothetical protein BH09SUM1_BH09SUM1_14720 [soil metagenome]